MSRYSFGYERLLFARPEFHDMLFSKIPKEKIHLSKKVLSFQQNHEGVMVCFSDNTSVHGDILVGADGAHSAVRQHLYKTLTKEGLLLKSDNLEMKKGFISLLGTTNALDPERYPDVLKEDCQSYGIIGDGSTPYTVSELHRLAKYKKKCMGCKRLARLTLSGPARFYSG